MKIVSFFAALLLLISTSSAFDTGHHVDIISWTLREYNFSSSAIEMVAISSDYADMYNSLPSPLGIPATANVHFDNLFNNSAVWNYASRVLATSQQALTQAARQGDMVQFLTTLGITLHALTDFYAHSNFITFFAKNDCNCIPPLTLFSGQKYINNDTDKIFSGASHAFARTDEWKALQQQMPWLMIHGDYCDGMNKDSVSRPFWHDAYVAGLLAAWEFVGNVLSWIDPSFVTQLQMYDPGSSNRQILQDQGEFMYRLAGWIEEGVNNGHWKGWGSGSLYHFGITLTKWSFSSNSFIKGPFVSSLNTLLAEPWMPPPTAPTANTPTITPDLTNRSYVVLRILRVSPSSASTLFATSTFDGYTFVGASQNRASNDSTPTFYTFGVVVPSTRSVSVSVEIIVDSMDLYPANAPMVISGSSTKLSFVVNPNGSLSGDVNGWYNSPERAYTSSPSAGSDASSTVVFYVSRRSISTSCGFTKTNGTGDPTCSIAQQDVSTKLRPSCC